VNVTCDETREILGSSESINDETGETETLRSCTECNLFTRPNTLGDECILDECDPATQILLENG
jgi:hypothetical protein